MRKKKDMLAEAVQGQPKTANLPDLLVNKFEAWPHQPEYYAIALIRKDGLWSVLELSMHMKEVQKYQVGNFTNFECAIDKAVRRLAQGSVRR